MGKRLEQFKRMGREDREAEEAQGNDVDNNTHYSSKNGHKQRSVANNPRKKSKRRG